MFRDVETLSTVFFAAVVVIFSGPAWVVKNEQYHTYIFVVLAGVFPSFSP